MYCGVYEGVWSSEDMDGGDGEGGTGAGVLCGAAVEVLGSVSSAWGLAGPKIISKITL